MENTTMKASVVTAAALIAGCAAMQQQETTSFTPPPEGTTWQMSQRNTGSYGNDAVASLTRGPDSVWQGQRVYQITNTTSGTTIMVTPDGRWMAILARDGSPVITWDPPIGYQYPLAVGKTWKTHHRATNHAAGRTVEFDYDCKVDALEPVSTKAGTFDAFRISCDNALSHDIAWYGKDIGVHVKQEFERKAANPSGAGTQRAELVAFQAR